MGTAQSSYIGTSSKHGYDDESLVRTDAAESMLQSVDKSTVGATGISLFHMLTFASIGASIALYLTGRREAGVFVGLWPPTFQALKAVVDKNSQSS
jgi:hypothetical protein